MKKQYAIALAAILAGGTLCASGVLAAQEEQTARGYGATSGQTQEQQDLEKQQQTSGKQPGQQSEFKALSSLSGMQIQNQQGQQLGSIDQVLVDMNQGRLAFVVVNGGATAAGGEKYVVPWQMVRTSPQQDGLILNVSSLDQLRPIAAGEQLEQTLTRQSGREIFQFYGVSPYWEESGQQMQQDQMKQMQQERMQQIPPDQMHQQMMEQMRQQREQMPQTPQ